MLITVGNRLWFFTDVPIPALYPDSSSYYILTRSIMAGQWPEFTIRTPGYPVLLALVFGVSNSLMAVVLAQHALMLCSCLLLVYAFHAIRPWLSIWAALALSVYTCGVWSFEHDTAIMSDSPYSYAIVLVFGFLILALVRRRAGYFVAASTAMAGTILLRPAGMFLVVIYGFCLFFLWRNRFHRAHIAGFAAPLPVVLLLLCTYNYATFGSFSMTAFGESQLAFATFTFWESDETYPPNVNDAIRRVQDVMRERLTDEQRALLAGSWDLRRLGPIFLAAFYYPALDQASTLDGTIDYLAARHWIRRVSLDSIAKHLDLYAKFVLTQLFLQFSNVLHQQDFMLFLNGRILELYGSTKYTPGKGPPLYVEMAKEYATRPAPPGVQIEGEGVQAHAVVTRTSASRRLYLQTLKVRETVFAAKFWVFAYFAALSVAATRLVLTKGRHLGAFIAFILTISLFGASLVIALVEIGGHRYSYVLEYVYYLPVSVLPFLRIGRADGFETAAGPITP